MMRSPGGRELSLSACPGVGNRPPSKKKVANSRGCARGGMVTGRIEPCINGTEISGNSGKSEKKEYLGRYYLFPENIPPE